MPSTSSRPPTGDRSFVSSDSDTINNQPTLPNSQSTRPERISISHADSHHVEELARHISKVSHSGPHGDNDNPFLGSSDPKLDPTSGHFDHKAWIRTVLDVQSRDPERFPTRRAGISFKNLGAFGFGTATDYQRTVTSVLLEAGTLARRVLGLERKRKIQILRDFDGLVRSGELLVVLGRPGSGCTTFLKTIAGETHGFYLEPESEIHYEGIPRELMTRSFRGEVIYQAETDHHFPQLTVSETLTFAALARTPHNRLPGVDREQWASHMRDVTMAVLGLSHTFNTRVGNEYVRGVSGGERKRVSIAEAILSGAPVQCWDNSTRGLDSQTALEFVRTLRTGAEASGCTAIVAIYQASQSAYDLFDKVVLLYEGRQIYFGPTGLAKQFFIELGYDCPPRQTTADFLTSLTNPAERIVRPGFEGIVPRTPDEFAAVWKASKDRARLLAEIDDYEREFPVGGANLEEFKRSRRAMQAKGMSVSSPYTLSIPMQIKLCLGRGFQRLKNDMALFFTTVIGNSVITIILSSAFLNLPTNTGSFYSRSALLFWAILMNAFASALEILSLYVQRPIVEKHSTQYAFYHPYAEACASMIVELPSKIITAVLTNVILYFMTNLRRDTAGAFFIFFLFNFTCTLVMSMIFRTIGAATKTIHQAMPPAALFILALITYTGFTIPTRDMKPWFRWINYLNPIGYAFEALMVNEFASSTYPCSNFVPSYPNATGTERVCSVTGAHPGDDFVNGAEFIAKSYEYYHSHLWRNFGILIAFMLFFLGTYLFATEYVSSAKSKGEVLVFKRGYEPVKTKRRGDVDEEGNVVGQKESIVDKNTSKVEVGGVGMSGRDIFMWRDVCYDIKIKKEDRRLLDHVDGWVMPGTLTALMGVSGAGKTTLLDVLASRVTMGVVSGDMLVNGLQRDASFQRKTGYVQQQDLHLQTSTVREALVFSALLRQPQSVSKEEKLAYVEEVIKLLDMEDYAEAVVGILGEGLNVEQRKRLTIAVELAAKPQLLLFLDEPTSGLDSQTAWSICSLMRKLANSGQAILCTIHQPSAILFQEFDRLLFLAPGGRTVYFGEIGANSQTLINYFEGNGAKPCPPDANPAEWMLEVVGDTNKASWPQIWNESPERRRVRRELGRMQKELSQRGLEQSDGVQIVDGKAAHGQAPPKAFAASFVQQFWAVYVRVMQQYWRTPTYIWSKAMLSTLTSLLVGFSFYQAENTLQGMQNQMFAVFMLMTVFGNLVQQIMPHFVTQRALYEVRERPSKTYSWQAFMLANICAELPWQTLMSVLSFVSFYYPIGLDRNAKWIPGELHQRAGLFFLLIWVFYLFTSTFSHMVIAGVDTAENGGNIANLLFTLCLIFCGVLVQPKGFWIFMYRVSPFTYLISALLSTGIAHAPVHCSDIETAIFQPPSGQTCQTYMDQYISLAGGYLYNPDATSDCQFCSVKDTDVFLAGIKSSFDHRWRDFGLVIVYLFINIIGALFFYWLIRVPRGEKKKEIGTISPDGDITPDVVEMRSLDGRESEKKVPGA